MLLTITNERSTATDLGYLLHKNPARTQTFDLPFGKAHVFYPEATDERSSKRKTPGRNQRRISKKRPLRNG